VTAAVSVERAAPRWLALATAGSATAGAIHMWAAVNHGDDGARYVVFFLVAALAQVLLAGLLAQRGRPLVAFAGALGTMALLAMYVVDKTTDWLAVGGHQHGDGVPVSLGVAVVIAEIGAVVALSTLVSGRWRSWLVNLAALSGVALWALWFVGR
jgi:hypothetical protein